MWKRKNKQSFSERGTNILGMFSEAHQALLNLNKDIHEDNKAAASNIVSLEESIKAEKLRVLNNNNLIEHNENVAQNLGNLLNKPYDSTDNTNAKD